MECDHCVIRVRYNAHKPGETPFLQCADIRISSSVKKSTLKFTSMETQSDRHRTLPVRRALKLKQMYDTKSANDDDVSLYGFAHNPFEPKNTLYVSVGTSSGQVNIVRAYDFGIDSPGTGDDVSKFLVDEVVSVDIMRNTSYILINDKGDREQPAQMLYDIGSTNGSVIQMSSIFGFKGGAINALSWYTYGMSAAFRIQPAETEGMISNNNTVKWGVYRNVSKMCYIVCSSISL